MLLLDLMDVLVQLRAVREESRSLTLGVLTEMTSIKPVSSFVLDDTSEGNTGLQLAMRGETGAS